MKLFGWFVGGLIALAVLRAAVTGLLLAILLAFTVALIRAPRETLAVLAAVILLNAFAAYPLLGLLSVSAALLVSKKSPK